MAILRDSHLKGQFCFPPKGLSDKGSPLPYTSPTLYHLHSFRPGAYHHSFIATPPLTTCIRTLSNPWACPINSEIQACVDSVYGKMCLYLSALANTLSCVSLPGLRLSFLTCSSPDSSLSFQYVRKEVDQKSDFLNSSLIFSDISLYDLSLCFLICKAEDFSTA